MSTQSRLSKWLAGVIALMPASLAWAAPQDFDFVAGCSKPPPVHKFAAREAIDFESRIRVQIKEGARVFWGFASAPVSTTGGSQCSEDKPLTVFTCNGVRIGLPEGTPDKAVSNREAAVLSGVPSRLGTVSFRLVVATEDGTASCERDYLLNIGVTNPDVQAPSVPGALSVVPLVPSRNVALMVRWEASTDNVGVTAYEVQRCKGTDCRPFTTTLRTPATTIMDRRVEAETTYRYRVRAIDAANNRSAFSNIADATTPAQGPPPPHER